MTTLFKPVLIETTEQMNALAPDVVVLGGPFVALKDRTYGWSLNLHQESHIPAEMILRSFQLAGIDARALVPIEAKEEWAAFTGVDGTMLAARFPTGIPAQGTGSVTNLPRHRRLVTPWEES